jgi:hypothetical protein
MDGTPPYGFTAVKPVSLVVLGSVLSISCTGLRMLLPDERPWVVNATHETLEIRSMHSDGHTLKVMLYPGTSIALGNAEQPLEQIEVRQSEHDVGSVSTAEIQSCMADVYRNCLGWKVEGDAVKRMDRRKPDSLPAVGFGTNRPRR